MRRVLLGLVIAVGLAIVFAATYALWQFADMALEGYDLGNLGLMVGAGFGACLSVGVVAVGVMLVLDAGERL